MNSRDQNAYNASRPPTQDELDNLYRAFRENREHIDKATDEGYRRFKDIQAMRYPEVR